MSCRIGVSSSIVVVHKLCLTLLYLSLYIILFKVCLNLYFRISVTWNKVTVSLGQDTKGSYCTSVRLDALRCD